MILAINKKEVCLNRDPKKQVKGDDELYPWYDLQFCFAAIWSMGEQYKSPPKGTKFDFYVITDPDNPRFEDRQKKLKILNIIMGRILVL